MGLIEVTLRDQSVEINQLKIRIQKQEMQLSMANVQIETLLQAQHRDAYHNNRNCLQNVLQEMDARIKHLESKV
jgi:hypothetical protein